MNTYYARLLLYLFFTFSATSVRAQIIAPDTVCLGQISTLDAMLKHNGHTWIIDTTDISQYNTTPASASTTISAINTFYYLIQCSIDGEEVTMKGDITLIK